MEIKITFEKRHMILLVVGLSFLTLFGFAYAQGAPNSIADQSKGWHSAGQVDLDGTVSLGDIASSLAGIAPGSEVCTDSNIDNPESDCGSTINALIASRTENNDGGPSDPSYCPGGFCEGSLTIPNNNNINSIDTSGNIGPILRLASNNEVLVGDLNNEFGNVKIMAGGSNQIVIGSGGGVAVKSQLDVDNAGVVIDNSVGNDPKLIFREPASSQWNLGLDNDDDNNFKVTTSSNGNLGTSVALSIDRTNYDVDVNGKVIADSFEMTGEPKVEITEWSNNEVENNPNCNFPNVCSANIRGFVFGADPGTGQDYWVLGLDSTNKFMLIHKGAGERPRVEQYWLP